MQLFIGTFIQKSDYITRLDYNGELFCRLSYDSLRVSAILREAMHVL